MPAFINRLIPFIIIGITLVTLFFGLLLLSYLLLFGFIVGSVLFLINWLKSKFGKPKAPIVYKKTGMTIDSDDWKVL